ncbi:MAG TPA: FAD-dependent oxidoreductase [Rhizomicrobium sp.]|jgi:D-arginine dehydrogenase|nr:FAD-dependent oxidoreductase [Rhizomicrobium sp.]
MKRADIIIIGGGIAGVSVAAMLGAGKSIVLLERETMLAAHTTGRSAAVFTETYGNAKVRALTAESRPFFEKPPQGFAETPLLHHRPSLMVATEEDAQHIETFISENPRFARRVEMTEVYTHVPIVRDGFFANAAVEPNSADIDVHGLFEGFRRIAVRNGVEFFTGADVADVNDDGHDWIVTASGEKYVAPVVVNAAGAWAGKIGMMADLGDRGLQPMRRTAIMVDAPQGAHVSNWWFLNEAAERFYFKPDAGAILASLADETPSDPCDAQPEEIDVATIAFRLEEATTLSIKRIRRSWAGLRTFTPNRTPIFEFDPQAPGFFWLAGQGGYGIQTAPALARHAAQSILAAL